MTSACFSALLKEDTRAVTTQSALKIKVLIRDKETKEPVQVQYIKRGLLAKLLHEHKVLGLNGMFVIEV